MDKAGLDAANYHAKSTLFSRDLPRWMGFANVGVALLLLISVGFELVVAIFFMRPYPGSWNIFDLTPKHGSQLAFIFTGEVIAKATVWGLGLAVGLNAVSLARAMRLKLNWNTFLAWLCIHTVLLSIAYLGILVIARPH